MVLLEPDRFIVELEKCLTASKVKKKGTVLLAMKRYDGRTKPKPRDPAKVSSSPPEYSCLVRATYDKRKLSVHVAQKDLNKFQIAFSALLRTGMSNIGKKPVIPAQSPPAAGTSSAVPAQPIQAASTPTVPVNASTAVGTLPTVSSSAAASTNKPATVPASKKKNTKKAP